jgi:prepilin-type processing-associated H-X9-DG protein
LADCPATSIFYCPVPNHARHPSQPADQGCNLSFADSHVEHWKWKVPKMATVPRGEEQAVAANEWDDYNWLETGFRQNFD